MFLLSASIPATVSCVAASTTFLAAVARIADGEAVGEVKYFATTPAGFGKVPLTQ